jgi:nitroreductase
MNEVIAAIKGRRSVRAYKPDLLKKAEIDAIIEAGVWAPSGHNAQAWHFTAIQDRAVLEEINARAKERMLNIKVDWIQAIARNPNADITHKAPALVIVSLKKGAITGSTDCAAAMENMMIAAQSMGIGSCWMGLVGFLFGDAEYMKSIGVPEGYEANQASVFGYPAEGAKREGPERKMDVVNYIGKFI